MTSPHPALQGYSIVSAFRRVELTVDYISPFDATIVTLLKEAGAEITGKTNMDEFAMGSTSTNNVVSVINPYRGLKGEHLCAGGSSGGSAVSVAAGFVWG
jgi:aspartyl-tRNA(Asn)/glutamyl-tRNA(Gln) amidotransferase subunit A